MSSILAWTASLAFAGLQTAAPKIPEASASDRPRLAVVIVVDQMRPEQLERLHSLWTGGFKRFDVEGRKFTEARYEYANTETGPGHTTIGTGRLPLHHRIVSNEWFLRDKNGQVYCVEDDDSNCVRSGAVQGEGGFSPHNIHGDGFSDILKRADPKSKCVTISDKDRAAIGMGGQHPDLVLWWDHGGNGFESSQWYVHELPNWVDAFNAKWIEIAEKSELGGGWKSSLPAKLDGTLTAPDDRPGEVNFLSRRHTFPYDAPKVSETPTKNERASLANYAYSSPLGDELVLDLAREAVEKLELGQDEHVDYLGVSLSGCDIIGHACGPYSCEVTDLLLRDDRALEQFFALLDQKVGKGRWIAALSADHGVLDLPETLVAQGVDAARISGKDFSASIKATRAALKEKFGDDFYGGSDTFGMRLSSERMSAAKVDPKVVRAAARDAFQANAAAWCERVFTSDELAAATPEQLKDDFLRFEFNSFDVERSCDLIFLPKSGRIVALSGGTTHGTPHPYDRSVPLVFLGSGVRAGSDPRVASPVDIVPTLLGRIGVALPTELDGRNLPLDVGNH